MTHPPAGKPLADVRSMPSLSDRAYERIRHDIITCAIAPGTEVSEAQLCAHFRLGKAPVRMALNRLAHDGLVRAIPRRGYRVTAITIRDIHDVFELRLMLEPAAARMAAGRVDAPRLRALDEVCRAGYLPGDTKSTSRFLEANKAFHVEIARSAGNSRLADAVEQLLDEMTRLLHLGLGPRNRSLEMQREHRALVKALERGDSGTAERICREQIEAARGMVLSAILTSRSVMNLALGAEGPR
ncbi:MAG TPA: GntR family transcriptional regulator [Burkholderiales bacterium]|nr:GntR family transcriptional regulator [Burkholderiales bacterium]